VTLRARLSVLFLAAIEVTFLAGVGAWWGLGSWRGLVVDLTLLQEQRVRVEPFVEFVPGAVPATRIRAALGDLARQAGTRDEAQRVSRLAVAVGRDPAAVRGAAGRLAHYYDTQHRLLRVRLERLTRTSTALVVGVVGLMIVAFVAFLAAIRRWLVEPVRTLERATQVISTGDLSHRVSLPRAGELSRLAASINRMAESLGRIQAELIVRERFALLGELAAYVAHNIRNPLASIRATAQGELIALAVADPRRAVFEDIVTAADRLGSWVTDLLRSASPVALDCRDASVSEVVLRCADLMRPRLDAAGVGLTLAVRPTPALPIDEVKLEQVVTAVLANAAEASPQGGRIRVAVAPEAATVSVRIADEGAGIPPEQRGRLFTPFGTTKPNGTGLGLWLSEKIVLAHGGSIAVLDGDAGTTVEIRLPAEKGAACRPC
jgi:signal transduction histidine kinase